MVYVLVRQRHYDHLSRTFFPCDEIILAVTAIDEKEATKNLGIKLGEIFIRFMNRHFDDNDVHRHHTRSGYKVTMPKEVPHWYEPQLKSEKRQHEWEQYCAPEYMPPDIEWSLLRVEEIVR